MKGQTLIELLLVIGLTAIILPAILTGLVASRSGKAQQNQRLEAVALLKEAQEAVRNVREKDWNTFIANQINCPCHPEISGSSWILAAGSQTINGFTRSVVISDVNRDANGVIVLTGGTLDPSTKRVVTTVSWTTPIASSITSTTYIARLENITYTETTEAQFNAGTKTGVAVTNTSGGEVILGSGGQGDWCKPGQFIVAQLDLPKQGVADAITAIEGQAFVGTGDNSSGISFANISISNANPPVPSIVGTFDGYKTNGVFGETNYAYIATDNNNKEVVIIDLTQIVNGKYVEAGYFDAPGNKDGNQVWVDGNVGYMITNKKLYSFDLSSKSGSRPIKDPDGVALAGDGTRVVIVGSYAYVTIKEASAELQIIDVTDPNNLTIVGQADLTGKDAKDVFVNSSGTRAYLATGKQDSLPELFIVDVSTKTGDRPVIGTYDASGMDPKAVTVVPGNRAIIVGKEGSANSEEYQVVDITNEANPTRCGGLNLGDQDGKKVNGISAVLEADGDAYSYIMTGDQSSEFKIIEGGPGGQYASDGTFESQTIPIPMPVNSTSFNRFEVTVNRLSLTDIKFQVAVAKVIAGSCSGVSFNFVGADGTNSTFFTTSVTSGTQTFDYAIPTAINPGQCFRYKVFLSTTDSSQTPIFYDITINYAP